MYIVGHVHKVGPRRIDLGRGLDCLLNREVGRVWAMTECVEHEGLCGLESCECFVGDVRDIGAIGEREDLRFWVMFGVKEESEDGEFAVVEVNGGDVEAEEGEGLVGFNDVWDEGSDE